MDSLRFMSACLTSLDEFFALDVRVADTSSKCRQSTNPGIRRWTFPRKINWMHTLPSDRRIAEWHVVAFKALDADFSDFASVARQLKS